MWRNKEFVRTCGRKAVIPVVVVLLLALNPTPAHFLHVNENIMVYKARTQYILPNKIIILNGSIRIISVGSPRHSAAFLQSNFSV